MGQCFTKAQSDQADSDQHVEFVGGNVRPVTSKEEWDQKLSEAKRDGKIVIANFSAAWCGPCRMLAPFFCELSEKYPSLMFLLIDVDELTDFSTSWDIKATPTFFFLKNGQQIDKLVGAHQRSMVYCRSDAACLCLSCDRNVHSANALSKRHSRTLLCERCNSQPAFVRCAEERISLCQNCDWMGHGTSTSNSTHKRQTINCYSGCPSAAELSSVWSFVLESPSAGESACEQELGLMSITENAERTSWDPTENTISQNGTGVAEVNDDLDADKGSSWGGSASVPELRSAPRLLDQPAGSTDLLPKLCCPQTKCPGLCEDDLYADFNMDEVDLNLENYEELFGVTLNHSEELFENGGIDSLFGTKDMSAADSNCQGAVAAEGSSVGLVNAIQPACSNAASADSMMSNKTDSVLCFTARQAHSSLSFSGLTGESSAGDYQDCGASSMLLMGEPPWCPPCNENSFSSATRSDAVMRYKEKKKTRKFEKRVRYASRKARADVRKRVKGRFVKAGDAYDYDPLNQTRSC